MPKLLPQMHLVTSTHSQDCEGVRRVPVGNRRSLLVRQRPGRSVPVVLLHGLLDSSRGWRAISEALSGPTVTVDLPGFGASSAPSALGLDAYADDVVRALTGLRLPRFVLVGHSLGGMVATAVAERMRDDVAALVLLAPAGFGRIPLAEAVSLPGVRTVVDRLLPHVLTRPTLVGAMYRIGARGPAPEPALTAELTRGAKALSVSARHAVRAIVAAGTAADGFHRRTVAYDGPVHAVWGDRDTVVPIAHLSAVEAAFPHVFAEVWEGMGHDHQRAAPDRLAALINRVSAAAALPSLVAARQARVRARALATAGVAASAAEGM